MKSYTCKMCGAKLIVNNSINFTNCLYCGNSIAIIDEELQDLNIKKIIPFTIEKEEAIESYRKILGKEIIEAKKVYVPVRLCNFDFDYLLYYEYRVEHSDSDGGSSYSYYDAETLIDGFVNNEFVFGNSKVDNVLLVDEIRKQARLDYDPVLLKDVSIECSNFDDSNLIKRKLEQDVRKFGRSKILRDISAVYSENYFIYGINYEPFTTLIPVYIVKTTNGEIYNYPGVNPDRALKISNSSKIRRYISIPLIIQFIIYFYKCMTDLSFQDNIGSKGYFLSTVIFVVGLCLFFSSFGKKKQLMRTQHDNYSYNKYDYGDHRKNVK